MILCTTIDLYHIYPCNLFNFYLDLMNWVLMDISARNPTLSDWFLSSSTKSKMENWEIIIVVLAGKIWTLACLFNNNDIITWTTAISFEGYTTVGRDSILLIIGCPNSADFFCAQQQKIVKFQIFKILLKLICVYLTIFDSHKWWACWE